MNTTETIRARRSVRKYQPGTVIPKEHLDLMLEAAMKTFESARPAVPAIWVSAPPFAALL